MKNKILNELIISAGFLEGLWIAAGTNPTTEIVNGFVNVFSELSVGTTSLILFKFIPTIGLFVTLFGIYLLGGRLGLLGVVFAFIGGLLILVIPTVAIGSLMLALAIGAVAEE